MNYEMALSTLAADNSSLDPDGAFGTWWADLWVASRAVDRRFIRRYADLRQQVLERNPILRAAIEVPETIKDARHFFLEVGAASGPPDFRHQVEFPKALAEFFGAASHMRRDLKLRQGIQVWEGRPLSYKHTSYGVDIWRLGMPTQTTGGPPIAHMAIRFKRTEAPDMFDFEVAEVDGEEFRNWEWLANLSGHLGATQGQRARKYGFY